MNQKRFFLFALFLSIFEVQLIFSMVTVDTSCQISAQEKAYVDCRKPFVDQAIRNFIGKPNLPENLTLPKIGMCNSGGGYRAFWSSLGFLMGTPLNIATYNSVLSGSTWMLGDVLLRNSINPTNFSLENFKTLEQQRVASTSFYNLSTLNWQEIEYKLFVQYVFTKKINPSDLWGAIIADRLFGDLSPNTQAYTFATTRNFLDPQNFISQGNCPPYPFPIFTSSITSVWPYQWLTVNPWWTGSNFLGGYIPTYAFNSPFYNGASCTLFLENTLSSFLGMFGLAFSISFWDAIKAGIEFIYQHHDPANIQLLENTYRNIIAQCREQNSLFDLNQELAGFREELKKIYGQTCKPSNIHNLFQYPDKKFLASYYSGEQVYQYGQQLSKQNIHTQYPDIRFLASYFNNFTYQMQGLPLAGFGSVNCSDGGMAINLPTPPLLERQIDVYLICDASSNAYEDAAIPKPKFLDLHLTKYYADTHGYPFPSIENPIKIADYVYLFQDQNSQVPTVVYFENPIADSTLKFDYTINESELVITTMENLIIQNLETIKQVIIKKIEGLNNIRLGKKKKNCCGGCFPL